MSRVMPSIGLLVGLVGFTLAGLVSISLASFQQDTSDLPKYEHLGMDFELESTGDYNSLSSAKGKAVLVSFGFTSCHDICPMMLSKYDQVYQGLDKQGIDDVVMYFVTIDPARDTLAAMTQHFESFDERIIGLRGSEAQIDALQKSLAVFSQAIEGTDQIAHSDRIFVFDGKGQLRAMPTLTDPAADVVNMVASLVRQ